MSVLIDLDASVFASRLNSCIMKSSLRPQAPPFFITLVVSFTNTSTNITNQVTWTWNFGNGIISNDEQPGPVNYIHPGRYNVSLTAQRRNCTVSQAFLNSLILLAKYLIDL